MFGFWCKRFCAPSPSCCRAGYVADSRTYLLYGDEQIRACSQCSHPYGFLCDALPIVEQGGGEWTEGLREPLQESVVSGAWGGVAVVLLEDAVALHPLVQLAGWAKGRQAQGCCSTGGGGRDA